jgi:LmbE family N-acetylglucosaminyl deacetylase
MLRRLNTTARLMQTVAHPDDEDGGMLTLESRGHGDSVVLLTLNRGEGGQNKLGSNLFDVLGVLRTLELTAADRYYGVDQRFTRVADFGFSKTPEETFQKWQGHDIPLGDMVRVIRTFRPDVVAARFSGTSRDGHGHHQASAILAKEAFRAAADPNRFPEQIKEGLQPWQAKKVYVGNVCGFGAMTCPDADYTVKLNTGQVDPLLKMSYIEFALEGLRHQLSQGAGGWSVEPGDRFTFYKLVDSVLPAGKEGHEKDFFDGVDTSLSGLATRLGNEAESAPFLPGALASIQDDVNKAGAVADRDPADAIAPLLDGGHRVSDLIAQVSSSKLSSAAKTELLTELRTKQSQFEKAATLAGGVQLQVAADVPIGKDPDHAFMAVPGQSFEVTARYSSTAKTDLKNIALDVPSGWKVKEVGKKADGDNSEEATFHVTVAGNAQYTRPYWHRNDPENDAINIIDDPQYVTLPFPPPPVRAHAVYAVSGAEGTVSSVVTVPFKDSSGASADRALAVAPAFSVALEPGEQVIRQNGEVSSKVRVSVFSNLPGKTSGTLKLEVPDSWRVEPADFKVDFQANGETRESEFTIYPTNLKEERTEVRAIFHAGSHDHKEGYSVVSRQDLDTFYYYQPAVQKVSVVNVSLPKGLKVGYIMGAGDDIPTVLQQIGIDVTVIDADKLATTDLSQFGTIVLGIRAYDTQKAVATNNPKLLDWTLHGGTLVVQYNASVGDFNSGKFTPYSVQLSRARVSVEDAPVTILDPKDSVFNAPNKIAQSDFDGWVQERGLYFMDHWDGQFKPLLSCHDPGESAQDGGLLRAQYGKGTYIYTGYSFFRQLPAGVPGAIRLYVNLLSAGH